jgi:hypothetical protein
MENARKRFIAPVTLGAIYGLSRIVYSSVGVRFDVGTITRMWHFIDIDLLELESTLLWSMEQR